LRNGNCARLIICNRHASKQSERGVHPMQQQQCKRLWWNPKNASTPFLSRLQSLTALLRSTCSGEWGDTTVKANAIALQ
jgi:hypothetical protein